MLRLQAAKQLDEGQGRTEFKSILEFLPPPTFGAGALTIAIETETKPGPPVKNEEAKRSPPLPQAPTAVAERPPQNEKAKAVKTFRRVQRKPTKDFVKQNAMNVSRKASRQSTQKEDAQPKPAPEEVQPIVIRSADYLKHELSKLQFEVVQKYNTLNSDDRPAVPLLRNSNLLQSVFSQFTDLIAIKWEEAAEALLDEMIEEEVLRLNTLDDTTPQEMTFDLDPKNFAQLIEFIDEVKNDEERMLSKYARGYK